VKARVLPLDSDEHRRTQALLPWFVNGTLDTGEAAGVAAHLAQCGRCQADAREQAAWRAALPQDAPAADVDRRWSSLRRRLEAPAAPDPQPAAAGAPPWWKPGWRFAVALQAMVIVVLAVALAGVSALEEPYRALGAAGTVDPDALVVFRPEATSSQLRDALRAADARIVGGPTVTDAYLLRFRKSGAAALATLRAQPAVARVESLRAEGTR
jgi:hypothetical protein